MSDARRRVNFEGFVLLAIRDPDGSNVTWRLFKELLISGPPAYGNDWATSADDPWDAGETEWAASGQVTPDGCMDWRAAHVHHCHPDELGRFSMALAGAYPTRLELLT